jgi:serine/threonine protein kinase
MREPAENQIIAGKYRIESIIGYGGMGSVWRARHVTLDMPVAIKFMAPQALADAESRQRFDREARALAALRTPHIVQVIDFGLDGETPYIVMELLEGEDLSTRLSLRRRLPLEEVSRILAHVARALRRAHEAGITHRDLKPSNIFLARVDDEEIIKVLDFGVAKLTQAGLLGDDGLTKAGTLLGSPGYMSPEQARGKEVDFRSDLWALSVIVFRAVTGMKPFAGDSIAELVIKLCIDPRPIPTRVAPDLPPAVDRYFEKAFAANPEDRFQSAVEMASAFAAMIGQRPPELSRSWHEGPPRGLDDGAPSRLTALSAPNPA